MKQGAKRKSPVPLSLLNPKYLAEGLVKDLGTAALEQELWQVTGVDLQMVV